MANLREGQWELDGFVFGDGTPIWMLADGWDMGSPDARTQDTDRPHRDGTLFGRDFLSGPEWQFTFGIQHGRDAWPAVREFQRVWRAARVRTDPGALSVLRYRERGTTYRLYGRARHGDVVPAKKRRDQFQTMTATFRLAAPEQYIEDEDGPRDLTLRLVPVPTGGGLRLPARLPWRLAPGSQATSGTVTVGGLLPAPFTATVHGPMSGFLSSPKISGDGWEIASDATLAFDDELVVDTAAMTITKNGQPAVGGLSLKTSLSARLAPGRQTIRFDGQDPTNTAYATLSFYDTIPA